ncbi:hypothetical protein AB0L06_40795 [Spirillospora sp. NPDC052269]
MSMKARQMTKNPIPAFFLGIGIVCLVAAAVGGHPVLGLVMLAIMAACSITLILLRRRSETFQGLTEEPDERFTLISLRAWAGTGVVLTLANLGAFVGGLASGHNGNPYYWLVGTAAITYVASVGLSARRT